MKHLNHLNTENIRNKINKIWLFQSNLAALIQGVGGSVKVPGGRRRLHAHGPGTCTEGTLAKLRTD